MDVQGILEPTHTLDAGSQPLQLEQREWLIANGTGAYAMGTAAGVPTRRYHGLFVAATQPPVGRVMLLNHVVEQLELHGDGEAQTTLELSTLGFVGEDGQRIYAPPGHAVLRSFERGLHVAWHYQWGQVKVTRTLRLHWKQQAASVQYDIDLPEEAAVDAVLRIRPLITMRDFHALMGDVPDVPLSTRLGDSDDTAIITRGDLSMTLRCRGTRFRGPTDWWRGVHYPIDAERGQGDREDLFAPGCYEVQLEAGRSHTRHLTVALGEQPADPMSDDRPRAEHLAPLVEAIHADAPAPRIAAKAAKPRKTKAKAQPTVELDDDRLRRALAIAADDFVVDRGFAGQTLSTILAGYPWFADWGRDTFIALPGLLLETQRFDEARRVLEVFASSIRNGLVPNRFDDYSDSDAHYNTVDASLWFVHAAMEYVHASGDEPTFVDLLSDACQSVLDAYAQGTDHGIHMDDDGLIAAGDAGTQLTWMDAAIGDTVFTPRHGKAVEINALWHHGLVGMSELLKEHEPKASQRYAKWAKQAKRSFATVFWSDQWKRLIDHVSPDGRGGWETDWSLRPNMVFATSLEHTPLAPSKRKPVLRAVASALLTPFGLRTLPADDAHYHPDYTGAQFGRDEAYHQGTVWPWLIGGYAEGILRADDFSDQARAKAFGAIQPLVRQMLGDPLTHCPTVGQLYEIHEAAEPHRPVGTPAQAWSVAEVLRVLRLIESR